MAKCFSREGRLEPTDVEALAASCAVALGREMGLSLVTIEGDSKVVVDSINSGADDCSQRGQMITDIKEDLRDFQLWDMTYVRRNANSIVDA